MTTATTATSPTTIKISYQDEIRRISYHDEMTFQQFEQQTRNCFPTLNQLSIKFSYIDDEDDHIVVSSDLEFHEALRSMLGKNNRYPRFEVSIQSTEPISNCKQCKIPLTGIIFQCSARSDFELCQSCEEKSSHQYPMIKYYPETSHSKIIVTINSNNNFTSTSQDNKDIFHTGVRCNECGVGPIPGIRYKCSGRDDYDLCSECEVKKHQPFPMLKIYSPEQTMSGFHIYNPNKPPSSTSAASASAENEPPVLRCEIDLDLDQGLQMLHQFLPHPHFPPDYSNRNWRERARNMFQRFKHSQHHHHPHGGNAFGHCGTGCSNSNVNDNRGRDNDSETQQIDEDILNIVLQESLNSSSSSSSPSTATSSAASSSSTSSGSSDSAHESKPDFESSQSHSSSQSNHNEEELWSRELNFLRAMGFTNQEALLPLLKEHLRNPLTHGCPNPEEMQNLIFSLLSNV